MAQTDRIKDMVYNIFDSDTSNYPKQINWDSGDPLVPNRTYSTAIINSNNLFVTHVDGHKFKVIRMMTADVDTKASSIPGGAPGCNASGMVQLTVTVNVDNETIVFDGSAKLKAKGNPCLDGTRGYTIVEGFFDAFKGFEIPWKNQAKED